MTQSDEEFLRLLHKQIEEHRRDYGITTIRALERRKKEQPAKKPNKKQPPKNR